MWPGLLGWPHTQPQASVLLWASAGSPGGTGTSQHTASLSGLRALPSSPETYLFQCPGFILGPPPSPGPQWLTGGLKGWHPLLALAPSLRPPRPRDPWQLGLECARPQSWTNRAPVSIDLGVPGARGWGPLDGDSPHLGPFQAIVPQSVGGRAERALPLGSPGAPRQATSDLTSQLLFFHLLRCGGGGYLQHQQTRPGRRVGWGLSAVARDIGLRKDLLQRQSRGHHPAPSQGL